MQAFWLQASEQRPRNDPIRLTLYSGGSGGSMPRLEPLPRAVMSLKPASASPDTRMPLGLTLLVAFIAIVETVASLSDRGILGFPMLRAQLFETGAFWTAFLHGAPPFFSWQPVTMFVSHSLLHGGMLHMVMNMAILLALGRFTADRYGPGVVLPSFLICAIAVRRGLSIFTTDDDFARFAEVLPLNLHEVRG